MLAALGDYKPPKPIEAVTAEVISELPLKGMSTEDQFPASFVPPAEIVEPAAPASERKAATTSTLATASLVVGISGLCCFPAGIVAVVLGILAIKEISESANAKTGKANAVAGIACGSLSLLLLLTSVLMSTAGTVPLKQQGASDQTAPTVDRIASTPMEQTSPVESAAMRDFEYVIVGEDTMLNYKRSLDVRLSKKVSERELRSLAYELKNSDPTTYERTFIGYYLPNMTIDEGSWATTHFNPNLDVRVLGFSIKQERAVREVQYDRSRQTLGTWLDETPGGWGTTMFRLNGQLYRENVYRDGSRGSVSELVSHTKGTQTVLFDKQRSDAGEFYWIDDQGNLQMWDSEGRIAVAFLLD